MCSQRAQREGMPHGFATAVRTRTAGVAVEPAPTPRERVAPSISGDGPDRRSLSRRHPTKRACNHGSIIGLGVFAQMTYSGISTFIRG